MDGVEGLPSKAAVGANIHWYNENVAYLVHVRPITCTNVKQPATMSVCVNVLYKGIMVEEAFNIPPLPVVAGNTPNSFWTCKLHHVKDYFYRLGCKASQGSSRLRPQLRLKIASYASSCDFELSSQLSGLSIWREIERISIHL